MRIQFVADFVHRIAPAFALEQQAGHGHDEAGNGADIAIGVNDAARNMDARRRACSPVLMNQPLAGPPSRGGRPKDKRENSTGRRNEIIILPDVLVRPARHARMRPRGTRHQRFEAGGISSTRNSSCRLPRASLKTGNASTRTPGKPGNFNNSAHFNLLPDGGHGRKSYRNHFICASIFRRPGRHEPSWRPSSFANFSLLITV